MNAGFSIGWNALDWIVLGLLALCVIVWPTQWITDDQNRWLRIAAVLSAIAQVVVQGPRIELVGAYLVAVLFSVRLLPKRSGVPSSVRESQESMKAKLMRWALVLGSAFSLALSMLALCGVIAL